MFSKYTTEKVLTMSFMHGEFLDQRLRRNPSQEWKDGTGERLFELWIYQFCFVGAIHADPHPGNYLYDDNGLLVQFEAPVFTVFPGSDIPNRIADSRRSDEPFYSLGVVCGGTQEKNAVKSRALRAAICNPDHSWFTHVVCTAAIARLVLAGGHTFNDPAR